LRGMTSVAWYRSDACDFKDVKVVILGQDPYHGPGEAHGLCFSVKEGVKIPPSLRNMYKELATDIPGFVAPKHGYLQSWSEQGVVLLNAVLTVKHKTPNSHKNQVRERTACLLSRSPFSLVWRRIARD
jgi:uracil-DNA glycosylase